MIRRGTTKDVELLQFIGSKTMDDTFGGTCTKEDMKSVLEKYFSHTQCEKELNNPLDNFFFLEEEGEVKGYMRINKLNDCPLANLREFNCIELVRLYVLKEYHGTHVANELIRFAFDFARQMGGTKMYLSVWEYNFRARGFYEKHGFLNSGVTNDFPLGSTAQTDYWFVKDLE